MAGRDSRVGWLYWYFWVIVVGFEAVAGAGILAAARGRCAAVACRSSLMLDDGDQPTRCARTASSSTGSPA